MTATTTATGIRAVRGLRTAGVALIAALAAAPAAQAHGDPASHYLETDALYPSYARQPSQASQLELLGLLEAAARRDYPIKVALVAGPEDLVDDLVMLRTPQRYADKVVTLIDRRLDAPVLIVTPYGTGVAGRASVDGRLRSVGGRDARALLAGIHVPREADGDQLAAAAMTAVRRIARAGGHALPAHVAAAKQYMAPPPSPTRPAATSGGGSGLAMAVPAILAALGMMVAFGLNLRRTRALRTQRPAA